MRNGESPGTSVARFAEELRAWRQRHGWSQAALGDKLGYSGSHVSSVETMDRSPTADFAKACDSVFGAGGPHLRCARGVNHSSKRVPTVFGMNASPNRAPMACCARHPVQ